MHKHIIHNHYSSIHAGSILIFSLLLFSFPHHYWQQHHQHNQQAHIIQSPWFRGWLASPPWQTLVQRQLPSAHFPDSTRITKPPPKPRRRKLKYYLWEERLTKTPCVYCVFLQLVKSTQYFSCFIVVLKPALAPQQGSREMQCMGTTQIHRYTLKNHFLIKYMSEKSHAKISKT